MRRLLLALLLAGTVAHAHAQVRELSSVVRPLDGSTVGDVTSVAVTATSPITGTSTCTGGACSFTLGLAAPGAGSELVYRSSGTALGAALGSAVTAGTGAITLTSQGAAVTPLTIVPDPGQTAALLNVQGDASFAPTANGTVRAGNFSAYSPGAHRVWVNGPSEIVQLASGVSMRWTSSDNAAGTPDTGLARASAGVVKATDGGVGQGSVWANVFRDGATDAASSFVLGYNDLFVGNNGNIRWSSAATIGSNDTGLARASAGVVKVTDGSTGAGSILVADGSAAAPSVAFASESGTGIWKAGTNKLGISVGGFSYYTFEGDGIHVGQGTRLAFSSGAPESVSADAFFGRAAAAALQLGKAANATPVANTLIVGESGSGTDIAGANGVIQSGNGTGTGGSGAQKNQTAYPAATGSTANTYTDRSMLAPKWSTLTESSATAIATITFGASSAVGAEFLVTVESNDGTDYQSLTSRVRVSSVRKAAGNTVSAVTLVGTDTLAESTGTSTLTATYTVTEGAGAVTLLANAVSSLTQTTLRATWQAVSNGPGVTLAQP